MGIMAIQVLKNTLQVARDLRSELYGDHNRRCLSGEFSCHGLCARLAVASQLKVAAHLAPLNSHPRGSDIAEALLGLLMKLAALLLIGKLLGDGIQHEGVRGRATAPGGLGKPLFEIIRMERSL